MYALFPSLNVVLEALHLCLHGVQMTVHNILLQFCSMMHAGTEVSFPPHSSCSLRSSQLWTSSSAEFNSAQSTHALNQFQSSQARQEDNKQTTSATSKKMCISRSSTVDAHLHSRQCHTIMQVMLLTCMRLSQTAGI